MWYSMTWNLIHLKSNAVLDIVKIDYSFKVLDLEKVEYLVFLFFSFLFFFYFLPGNPFYPKHSLRTTTSLEGLQTNIVYTSSSLDDHNHLSGEGGSYHLSFHGLLGPSAKFHPLPFLAYTTVAQLLKLHTN